MFDAYFQKKYFVEKSNETISNSFYVRKDLKKKGSEQAG